MENLGFRLVLAILLLLVEGGHAGWIRQPSGWEEPLNSVNFPVDAQTGYVVGNAGMILKTTCGGVRWAQQSASTTDHLQAVHFPVDAVTGYAVGLFTIVRTTDGGVSWQPRSFPYGCFHSVDFPVDARTGYVLGDMWIFKTTDGGNRWDSVRARGRSIDFPVDTRIGYIAGWSYNQIRKTTDGGVTWDSLTSTPWSWLNGICFPAGDRVGFVVGGNVIMQTADAGANWTTEACSTWLTSVHFPVNDRIGYAVGAVGTILRTTDGGATWQRQVSGTSVTLRCVYFPNDADTGYVVGDSGIILKTTDGGVGVEEANQRVDINDEKCRIRPNPFVSFAAVSGHEKESFTLFDVSGRRAGVFRGDRIGIGLAAGVYFIRADDRNVPALRVVKIR